LRARPPIRRGTAVFSAFPENRGTGGFPALPERDSERRFRGHRGPTPTQEEHRKSNLYKNLGAGGVDFPAIVSLLRKRVYAGWITLDLDPPRPGEGTIEENLEINRRYLKDKVTVSL
jgi:hypothetical protein